MRHSKILLNCGVAFLLLHGSAHAQQASELQRVGFLGNASFFNEFRTELAKLGFVNGSNVRLESRWPAGNRLDELPQLAKQLVDSKSQVIVAIGATAARATSAATKDIPIVFEIVVDPVAIGLTSNTQHPGANITGVTTFDPEQPQKQFEILKELLPTMKRVALLGDDGAAPTLFEANEKAARNSGLETQTFKVNRRANPDFDEALQAARTAGVDAVVVISTPVTTPNRKQIARAAAKYRLPTLSPIDHADAGGLLSYGTSFSQSTRRAAGYVVKILSGAKPGELPVETLKQQELVINVKLARELGLTIPEQVLSRATRVLYE
jgi:putative ABC transport system substrate-binding protein